MWDKIIALLIPALASYLGVDWVYFKVLRMAKEKNLVDNPDARKLQKTPVPVRGGVAVCFGMLCGMIVALGLMSQISGLGPVICSMLVMMYVGGLDDILSLSPKSRFLVEILVVLGMIWGTHGCIDSFHGLLGLEQFTWWVAVPLTVFAGVGIINAINMIDGVNGLSSGLCITYCVCFGVIFANKGDMANASLAFCMAAALLVFWLHNVFGGTSKMFIGDAGTMMMGTLMTWFVIQVLREDNGLHWTEGKELCLIAMCLSILVVPVFDTIRVMLNRMRKGNSPFSPDKTHLHHVFLKFGMSHSMTMLTIILMDVITVTLGYCGYKLGFSQEAQFAQAIFVGLLLVWGSYIALRLIEKHNKPLMYKMRQLSLNKNPEMKAWWAAFRERLDAPEFKGNPQKRKEILDSRLERKFNNPGAEE